MTPTLDTLRVLTAVDVLAKIAEWAVEYDSNEIPASLFAERTCEILKEAEPRLRKSATA
jgi:hypothetical protein